MPELAPVVVGGAEIGVRRAGEPTVLFLHGLAGHHGEWSAVIDELPPEVGSIAADLRGHGTHPHGWADDQSLVDDAIALAEPVGPIIVVGQSVGSVVGMRLAAERPDLVRHLVIVEGGIDQMTDAGLAGLAAWFNSWPSSFPDRSAAAAFFGADRPSTPAWVDGLAQAADGLVARFDAGELIWGIASIGGSDRADLWRSVTAPTTLIVGDAGAIDPADTERMLALRPEVGLVKVPDAGHDVHLDQPHAVAEVLAGLLGPVDE